jgi:hypothetical protein
MVKTRKARRTRRSRKTRGGTVYGSPGYAASAAKEAAAGCDAHVKDAVDGVNRDVTIKGKKQPYWKAFGYPSLEKAEEEARIRAKEQSPCKSEAVVVVGQPVQKEEATVRASAAVSPRPNPFGPQGEQRSPDVVGPGCTGPFCRGGKSRRRTRRRGARASRTRPTR